MSATPELLVKGKDDADFGLALEAPTGGIKLNLGSGNRRIEGFVGIDSMVGGKGTDIVHDLDITPWPIKSNSVSKAVMIHSLEHFKDPIKIMNELYRVIMPEGLVYVEGPYWTSVGCWQDPTHTHAISNEFFCYFNREWRLRQNMPQYPATCDFNMEKVALTFSEDFKGKTNEELEFALKHYLNVVENFVVILRATK